MCADTSLTSLFTGVSNHTWREEVTPEISSIRLICHNWRKIEKFWINIVTMKLGPMLNQLLNKTRCVHWLSSKNPNGYMYENK